MTSAAPAAVSARAGAVLLVASCLLSGCALPAEEDTSTGSTSLPGRTSTSDSGVKGESTRAASPSATKTLETLDSLAVKGRAPKTGYERDEFGQAWADVDRNGCDTRNDVLRRTSPTWS